VTVWRRRAEEPVTDDPGPLPDPAIVLRTPPPLPRPRVTADEWPTVPGPAVPRALSCAGEPAPPAPAAPPGAVHRVVLQVSDGTEVTLRGSVIIGRKPTTPERYAHVLALPDTTRTLSRDHLEVGLAPNGQVWVSDLGSANGTYVARGRVWTRLTPHQRNPVDANDVLRFADFSLRFRFEG
jgi:hypothetical protein